MHRHAFAVHAKRDLNLRNVSVLHEERCGYTCPVQIFPLSGQTVGAFAWKTYGSLGSGGVC